MEDGCGSGAPEAQASLEAGDALIALLNLRQKLLAAQLLHAHASKHFATSAMNKPAWLDCEKG